MNNKAFEIAKEWYDAHGVDVNAAMDAAAKTAISMHCWAGDDVVGWKAWAAARPAASPQRATTLAARATAMNCARTSTRPSA